MANDNEDTPEADDPNSNQPNGGGGPGDSDELVDMSQIKFDEDTKNVLTYWFIGCLVAAPLIMVASAYSANMLIGDDENSSLGERLRLFMILMGASGAFLLSIGVLYVVQRTGMLAGFICLTALIGIGIALYVALAPEIGEMPRARGMITGIFVVATITIGIILVVGVMFSKWETKIAIERFTNGKEIFTALIGILGAVIGFYFGAVEEEGTTALSVSSVNVSESNPTVGSELDFSIILTGGKAPFNYSIDFVDSSATDSDDAESTSDVVTLPDTTNRRSPSREIKQSISIPQDYTAVARPIGIKVVVTDANQVTEVFEQQVWITVQPKTPESGFVAPRIENLTPKDGTEISVEDKEFEITFDIVDGEAPYTYSVMFDTGGTVIEEVNGTANEPGTVTTSKIPIEGIDAELNVGIKVIVLDNEKRMGEFERKQGGWIAIKPKESDDSGF